MIATHGLSTTSAHYARMGEQECEKIHAATLENPGTHRRGRPR